MWRPVDIRTVSMQQQALVSDFFFGDLGQFV